MTDFSCLHPLLREYREISLISSIGAALNWDYQVNLPARAASFRGEQLAYLSKLAHERLVSDSFHDLLVAAEDNSADISHTNLKYIRRAYDQATKIPTQLVTEMAKAESDGYAAWTEARSRSDFSLFKPALSRMIELTREEAQCLKKGEQPLYDVLLDKYEQGMTSGQLEVIFGKLEIELRDLIASLPKRNSELGERSQVRFPEEAQKQFLLKVLKRIGFNTERGRPADIAPHPFCTRLGPDDVRMTTRYDEADFMGSFYSSLHEMGHGLYEQGLPADKYGLPEGEYVSLGVHESQSRLWENLVGRSREFWTWLLPDFHRTFPGTERWTLDDILKFVNDVRPSLIRTESDEVTYNLHVILRYNLEKGLVDGSLAVDDLPGEWNKGMEKYLGITPPNDALGCLQDVHWSGGAFGYFPTYTLGNIMASQLYDKACETMPSLGQEIAEGKFDSLIGWLRSEIHCHGKTYDTNELVRRVCGEDLDSRYLLKHLRTKVEAYCSS